MADETLDSGGSDGGDEPRRPRNFQGVFDPDSNSIQIIVPGWLYDLRPLVLLVQNPRAWIVAAILGIPFTEAVFRLSRGESAAEMIVEDYLYRELLLPFAAGIFNALVNALFQAGFFLFGPDLAVGRPVGIVDSPFALSGPIADTLNNLALGLIAAVHGFNLNLAQGLEPLGIAAPTLVTFIWGVQFLGFAYGVYVAVQALDILSLGVTQEVRDVLWALALPIRRLWGVFR